MMTRNCIESERFLLRVKIKGEPDVSTRAVARNIFRWAKTVNRKTLSKRFGLRTVLSKNQFGANDRRETVWRRRSGLSSIYMIRMGLRLVQMRGKKLQADDVMQRMPRSDLFLHLLFANSVQMDPDARSPHFHRRQAEIPVITFS